jgi:hypothetical protein
VRKSLDSVSNLLDSARKSLDSAMRGVFFVPQSFDSAIGLVESLRGSVDSVRKSFEHVRQSLDSARRSVDLAKRIPLPTDEMAGESPMGRPSTVEDVTNAIMYLNDAPGVTGDVLYVDAGSHLERW